ncbi:MAG: glutathione-disulfide reductase, partial [Hyphomicrobiales bacterium]
MASFDYDLFTIGAGSGGVRASRVSAAHGARVAVAEEYRVGGTCVIRGCVPKKMLVYGAQFAEDLEDARKFGWDIPQCSFDWVTLRDNVLNDVDRLNGIYTQNLETQGVEIIHERATLTGPHEITLASGKTVTAERILIATGARPHIPQFDGCEHGITSNEAFHLDKLPPRVLIAGAGYIANEFAGIFHQFGCDVTIINRSDQLLRSYDASLRDRLLQISVTKGIKFLFNSQFEKIEKLENGALRVMSTGNAPMEFDAVLYATGRLPNTQGLGLDKAGVELDENGAVIVDEFSKSSAGHIYAVGDVTDRVQLTPVAIREGQAFADTVFGGNPTKVSYDCIPSAVFSHPPIAAVGM